MDAEDIFRKLTTGAIPRFLKLPSNGKIIKQSLHAEKIAPSSLSQNVMKEKNNFLQIKRELLDEDEDEEEEELTLLGNMKAGKKDNKPNKKNQKLKKQKTKRQKSAELKLEKINQLRNLHRITVVGDNVPPPIETFDQFVEECKISTKIINNLKASGYVTPTPIQMQAIPVMLQSRQILACAPTGSGKTAAFVVPILHNLGTPKNEGFRALIVCPTRELARQIFRECSWLAEGTGLRAHIISKVKQSADKFGPKFANKFDILISTPNRIIYLLRQENVTLSLKTVEWLIVDESDKLFEVGIRGFRDQLAEIYKACDASNIKRAMFSATHTVHVTKWCRKNLKGLVSVTIGHRNTAADLVQQELIFVGSEHGKLIEFRNLVHQGLPPPVLVFVQSKDRAKELFNELIYDGINVDVIHADRTQFQRDNVVRAFREGKVWVLICTELMGRGIDFKGVNLVINYDFPTSAISYIHRIGRTGRAGRAGRAVTFFTESDRPALRSIATVMKDSGCEVPEYMLSLKKTSKRDRRKLEQMAPDRKPISTTPSYAKYKNNKLKKRIEMTKKQKETRKTDIGADCS